MADSMVRAQHAGTPYVCPRCQLPVTTDQRWDVGHAVDVADAPHLTWDPRNHRPEHATCNRSDGGRRGNTTRQHTRTRANKWL